MAAITRTSTFRSLTPPTRRNERFSSTRSSFTWTGSPISPISSRKSVPPSAVSNRPGFCCTASVKAPFSCPKSSLSSSCSGRAAQLMSTKAPPARRPVRWIISANTSLPTPDSPSMSTVVASLSAILRTVS